ncbi:MAG: hypothetical protein LUG57_01980 [Oscillospiraceae bacterium]|nr:hypothetical protein [Oscillospiraceae bacterium]
MKHLKHGIAALCAVIMMMSVMATGVLAASPEPAGESAQKTVVGRVILVSEDEILLEIEEVSNETPSEEPSGEPGDELPSGEPGGALPSGEPSNEPGGVTPSNEPSGELPGGEPASQEPDGDMSAAENENVLAISIDALNGAEAAVGDMLVVVFDEGSTIISVEALAEQ